MLFLNMLKMMIVFRRFFFSWMYSMGLKISLSGEYTEIKYQLMIFNTKGHIPASEQSIIRNIKVIIQGKLFHMCMHLFYCSVLYLGGYVNTSRMSQPDMGSIFHKKNQRNNLVIGSYYVNYQNY